MKGLAVHPMVRHLLHPNADAMARRMGFNNAQQAIAYHQNYQSTPMGQYTPTASDGDQGGSSSASSGSLLDRVLAIHPAVLLNHVLNGFTQAGQ